MKGKKRIVVTLATNSGNMIPEHAANNIFYTSVLSQIPEVEFMETF